MNFEKNIFGNSEEGIDISAASKGETGGEKTGSMSGKFWEKYKEKAKNLARIAYLGGALGLAAIGGSEYLKNSEEYKTHIEAESASERAKYEALRAEIIKRMGDGAIDRIEKAHRAAYFDRKYSAAEREDSDIKVSGFSKIGVADEIMRQIWTEKNGFYPASWTKNVGNIEYVEGDIRSNDYGDNFKNSTPTASNEQPMNIPVGQIKFAGSKFWGDSPRSAAQNFDYVFGHELAHTNDWESFQRLSRSERAELLLSVVERMNSKDHYRTLMEEATNGASYHSLIEIEDKNAQTLIMAKEYFASLAEGYFGNPDEMRAEHPEDFKIIDALVNKGDEKFIPEVATAKRDRYIDASFRSNDKK